MRELKSVRLRREILETFPVKLVIFRFSLDLIFSSKEIEVHDIKILYDIGSDHLPFFSKFPVSSTTASKVDTIDSDLKEEINEIIKEGHKAVENE